MSARLNRVAAIERQRPDLSGMTDDQLRAYADTLKPGSREQVAAVLALVGRRGSTLPIVHKDPEKGRGNVTPKDLQ